MRKKKYYRLLKNIGVWTGIVGWTLDSRGCFRSSTSYSILIDRNSIKVESTILSKPSDKDMIFRTKTIIDVDETYDRPPSIEIMISLPYEDYLTHNFNHVTVISYSKLRCGLGVSSKFSLKDLIDIEDRLKKIKK